MSDALAICRASAIVPVAPRLLCLAQVLISRCNALYSSIGATRAQHARLIVSKNSHHPLEKLSGCLRAATQNAENAASPLPNGAMTANATRRARAAAEKEIDLAEVRFIDQMATNAAGRPFSSTGIVACSAMASSIAVGELFTPTWMILSTWRSGLETDATEIDGQIFFEAADDH